MQDWLVILLSAPLASFGDSPGNAERQTGDMPSRSGLIGLAAAALGIERADQTRQTALSAALVTASALYRRGEPLADFHTFQSLHQSAKGAATRAEALKNPDHVVTSITRRHYLADGLWQAAYRLSDDAGGFTLETIADAFRRPRFTLSLGRKSCPLSHPLAPLVVSVPSVLAAFHEHGAMIENGDKARKRKGLLKGRPIRLISLEARADLPNANRKASQQVRHDQPLDRSIRWTFADRAEWRLALDEADAAGAAR